jgi:uncharacterized protein YqjF (DUF2071 family)
MSTAKSTVRADWTELVALNFHCDQQTLAPLVPPGLELDYFNDDTFLSLIAVRLKEVYVWNLPFAIGHEVDLVSLRFYVRRMEKGLPRERGVCLIKSFVSSRMAAWTLSRALKSPFEFAPFAIQNSGFTVVSGKENTPAVDYRWRADSEQNRIRVKGRQRVGRLSEDSIVGFLLQRGHWYSVSGKKTLAFSVQSGNWKVWDAGQASFTCDARSLFGSQFSRYITRRPASVFLAERSPVSIHLQK